MDKVEARSYLLSRPRALEDFPFGPGTHVFKIKGKMFATLGEREGLAQMNLKCEPDEAMMLRDIFDSILPGYHMNKKHWITVLLDGTVPEGEIERLIDRSYGLVVKSLSKKERDALLTLYGEDEVFR